MKLSGENEETLPLILFAKEKIEMDECHFYKIKILIHNRLLLSEIRIQ